MLGSLITPAIVTVRARRAAVVGGSGFITDETGFILYAIGALISVMFVQPLVEGIVTSTFQSVPSENVMVVNIIVFVIEFFSFRRFVLRR